MLGTDAKSILKSIKALPFRKKVLLPVRILSDSRVPIGAKLVIPGLLLYLIMPLDLIPDFIPVLGQLDDLLVIILALGLIVRLCPPQVLHELVLKLGQTSSPPAQPKNQSGGRNPRLLKRFRLGEKIMELFIFGNGVLAIVVLVGIFGLLLKEGLPIFAHTPFWRFLFGDKWYPVSSPPTFGILPFLVASLMITVGAIIIALPVGVATAAYLAEVAPKAIRESVKPLIELLAGVPSVVIGFVGLLVLTPLVRNVFHLNTGLTGLTAAIMLAFMSLPVIVSVSEDALSMVPNEYKEASYALGATRWQTIVHVLIPAAISGITAAVMLGVGRAIGETMTVLMVAGGALSVPHSLAEPMRPMTATIAAEVNNAVRGGLQYQALFAIGAALFLITFATNLIADVVLERQKRRFQT
ncbi:MAG: phosphate ABC transporter permease subunit PstC [Chloroflexi bacterium]|nr:phosphate ABC transporter permease subunit PstC [Chloroflexota bacterium]